MQIFVIRQKFWQKKLARTLYQQSQPGMFQANHKASQNHIRGIFMAKKKSTNQAEVKISASKPQKNTKATPSEISTRRFEFSEGKSSKFWEVTLDGSSYTVRFGRIGTDGQAPKVNDAGSPEKASATVEKLIREKTAKGYMEVKTRMPNTEETAENSAAPVAKVRYPSLAEARKEGATFLRSVFEGYGDDGCFDHTFLKNGSPIGIDVDPETDIESLIEENQFEVDGYGGGTVGILEIDLLSGAAVFWADFASDTERFAEFLLHCQWTCTTSLTATIRFKLSEDIFYDREIKNVREFPATNILDDLDSRLAFLLNCLDEPRDCCDRMLDDVRDKCGLKVELVVDVEKRTFTFSGNGKRLSVKVPKTALSVTRFKIDLGPNSNKTTNKSKKRGT
jgi:predicted DNA-binding WGR domain protein